VAVLFALGCLIGAKFANVTVPLIFKQLVDGLDISRDQAVIVVPAALRWPTGCCASPRRCSPSCARSSSRGSPGIRAEISLQVFRHLHALSLRFHLNARPAA
jgi:ATP-binding cassette subfamily B protein